MQKLPEVETAKSLMNEALAWPVMRWLREKKRVRQAADEANAALDRMNDSIQGRWSEDVRAAYQALVSSNGQRVPRMNGETGAIAKKIKDANDDARRARQDAEETFDKAEKQLSTSLAREGCRKAIHSWELHETAIRKAEAVVRGKPE